MRSRGTILSLIPAGGSCTFGQSAVALAELMDEARVGNSVKCGFELWLLNGAENRLQFAEHISPHR